MSKPQQSNPTGAKRTARAPYNFVPLPEQVVYAEQPTAQLPTHDRYHADLLSGRIECTLITRSPLYTRRAVSPEWWKLWAKEMDRLHLDEAAAKEYAAFFHLDQIDQPVIPGSSLRGMVRSIMEIIASGHVRWVGDQPTFTYRAVAAARTDPLREPYEQVIGRFSRNIKAGYLVQNPRDGEWAIQPAFTLKELGYGDDTSGYLRIKEDDIERNTISGFRRLNSPNYRPGFYPVRFNLEKAKGGARATQLRTYRDEDRDRRFAGVLVCSGNMLETGKSDQKSPRRRHTLLLAPTADQGPRRVRPIPISTQAVKDYLAGLTDFQREKLTDWNKDGDWGCLGDGKPVFYVTGKVTNTLGQLEETALYFGHTPNFRIPARLNVPGEQRASTPLDFVPADLRKPDDEPDLVEAIFGWVKEPKQPGKEQRAGRVFFSDARLVQAEDGLWLQDEPIALHTLSTPKPTTFQHYLTQDRSRRHDPDQPATLAHYGTSPQETEIRGYKRYWHKGVNPDLAASDKERQHPDQLTKVRPLKPGVQFSFTVRFENLSSVELGALLWVLALPGGEPGKHYYHKLGMGKPLGMGAVEITPTLYLDQRQDRYRQLFAGESWHQPSNRTVNEPHLEAFETYLRDKLAFRGPLAEQMRIRTLLALLEWREGGTEWLDQTRYLEIERGLSKVNEYKERPVLPDAETVAAMNKQSSLHPERIVKQPINQKVEPAPQKQAEYHKGKVVRFGLGRNQDFGFIKPDTEGDDLYFNYRYLKSNHNLLTKLVSVQYRIEEKGPNGKEARDVTVIS